MTYSSYRKNILNRYRDNAMKVAQLVASYLDTDTIYYYMETKTEDKEYNILMQRFENIKESMGMKYIYVLGNVSEEEAMYIMDVYTEEEREKEEIDEGGLGYLQPIRGKAYDGVRQVLQTGKPINRMDFTNSIYGQLASSYYPILDEKGNVAGIVGVDIPVDEIINYIKDYLGNIIILITIIIIICFAVLLYLVQRYMVQPLKLLDKNAKRYTESNHSIEQIEEFYTELSTKDEIQDLAVTFNNMIQEINQYIKDIKLVTIEKERLGAELQIATQIQESMLPNIFPAFPERTELDIYAHIISAKEMGGGFYDFFFIDKTHFCVVMGEVAGEGIPAALMMVITKTMIKDYAQLGYSPEKICQQTNNQLSENNQSTKMIITAFIGILDLSNGVFIYVNAGHSTPYYKKSGGEFQELKSKGCFALGDMADVPYYEQSVNFVQGDMLYFYTKGIIEAKNQREETYSKERMENYLNKIVKKEFELEKVINEIEKNLEEFIGEREQTNDRILLILRYFGI